MLALKKQLTIGGQMINRLYVKKFYCFVLLLLLVGVQQVAANSQTSQIEALIVQGELQKALSLTNKQLVEDATNVNYLFLKGLILTKQNALDKARDIFIELTEKHPELPEPFNNLAVVYAAKGDYVKARQALQQAINTHPSYATAHENIGDIYAKMASKAYNQALQLDKDNETAREKLSLIGALIPTKGSAQILLADTEQPDAKKARLELNKLEQVLAETANQTRQQQANVNKLRADLARLEKERIKLAAQLDLEREGVDKQARQARLKAEKARKELARLEQQTVKAIELAGQDQQKATEQARQEQEKLNKIRAELARLEQTRIQAAKQASLQQAQTEEKARHASMKAEQFRAEINMLEKKRKTLVELEQERSRKAAQDSKKELAELKQTMLVASNPEQVNTDKQSMTEDVIQTVMSWADDWSTKDVDGYLSHYADEFTLAKGLTRKKWSSQRRLRILKPRFIRVEIIDPKVTFFGDEHAQVSFIQKYQSDTFNDRVKKVLLIKYVAGNWLIVEEKSS